MSDLAAVLIFMSSHPVTRAIPLFQAIDLAQGMAEAVSPVDTNSHEYRVRWAKSSDSIKEYHRLGQKIPAIKELRTVLHCGLKEAKEAVEEAFPGQWVGLWTPPAPAPADLTTDHSFDLSDGWCSTHRLYCTMAVEDVDGP